MGEFVDRDSFTRTQDHNQAVLKQLSDHIWIQSNIVLMSDERVELYG